MSRWKHFVRNYEEGWVSSEFYRESFARNRELRLKITEAADEDSRNEMWRVWPFKDDDDRSEWRQRE